MPERYKESKEIIKRKLKRSRNGIIINLVIIPFFIIYDLWTKQYPFAILFFIILILTIVIWFKNKKIIKEWKELYQDSF